MPFCMCMDPLDQSIVSLMIDDHHYYSRHSQTYQTVLSNKNKPVPLSVVQVQPGTPGKRKFDREIRAIFGLSEEVSRLQRFLISIGKCKTHFQQG